MEKNAELVAAAEAALNKLAASFGAEVVRREFSSLMHAVNEAKRESFVAPYSGSKIGFLAGAAS